MARELVISADNDGRRVDRVLRTLWPGVPLGAIMKAIRTGEVRIDGKRTKGEARLAEGQRLTVPWEDGAKEAAAPARELPPAAVMPRLSDAIVLLPVKVILPPCELTAVEVRN